MPATYPLATFILAILAVYATAKLYRSLYPYDRVREAMEVIARYRITSRMPGKRAAKRARAMAPLARDARRLILKALLAKTLLMTSVFIATMIIVWRVPVAFSPFDLPPVAASVETEEGVVAVAYTPIIHLMGYIYGVLLFRDYLL